MSKFRVVVTDDRFGNYKEEEEMLAAIDAKVEVYKLKTEEETIQAAKDADALLVNLQPIREKIINNLKKCKVLSRYGVGYDNIDVDSATKAGIWVAHVPDYSFEDVSDQAMALLLACVRKISYKDKRVREGGWDLKDEQPIYRIKGKILGLIGYGLIARSLHRKMSGFGLSKVLVHDPFVQPGLIMEVGGNPVNLETLLKESDYVSVHVPLLEETKGMIGVKEISLMKPTAILINTSRGPVIDEHALCEALREGKINSAGLDVFEVEPLPHMSPLKKLDNVVLSDHSGFYSEESIVELKTKAALNVLEVLKGGEPVYPVNQV